MIISFAGKTTEDIYNGDDTRAARKIPTAVWKATFRKLDMINAAKELKDLRQPPGNRLEALRGQLEGYHSIRINNQFRIVFLWANGGANEVRITDYH